MSEARRHLIRLAGEGALAGLVAGAAPGMWAIRRNHDLAHGMAWFAAERLIESMSSWVLWGVAASALLALIVAGLDRCPPRAARAGTLLLGFAAGALAVVMVYPLRGTVFPHSQLDSGSSLRAAYLIFVAATGLLLFARVLANRPGVAASRAGGLLVAARAALGPIGILAGLMILSAQALSPRLRAFHASDRPSVILVSLDTLRADRLGAMGYPRPLTPLLDSIAVRGVVFDQATAPAPWTLPSHVSLFTSLLPYDHGVVGRRDRIGLRSALLAERFRDAGYRTAAFTGGGYVSASFGFGQGFEVYGQHDESLGRGAQPIADAALEWIRSVRSAPFFLFVHTYEVHYPYVHTDFADRRDAGRLPPTFQQKQFDQIRFGRLELTESERRYVSDLYDGDVAEVDRVVGGLLRTLQDEGVLDRALVVVLSDHGEDLWDHDLQRSPRHGHSLYQEVLRVPLFIHGPGRIREGVRIQTPVSLLDVAPTLLEMAGLPADPNHRGRSLAGTLRSAREPEPKPVYSEALEEDVPERFAVRDGDLKVILTPYPDPPPEGEMPLMFRRIHTVDLGADPLERLDVTGMSRNRTKALTQALWKHIEQVYLRGLYRDAGTGKDPVELIEQLRALRYVP